MIGILQESEKTEKNSEKAPQTNDFTTHKELEKALKDFKDELLVQLDKRINELKKELQSS